jgi:predicted GNAT family acetyltransferase
LTAPPMLDSVGGGCARATVRGLFLNVTVSVVPERSRYEISVDGECAGFTRYRGYDKRSARPGEIVFLHTEIDDSFSGQGLGSTLIRYALDDARKKGLAVIPYCPFVRGFIAKHEDYLDLVPEDRRAEFEL